MQLHNDLFCIQFRNHTELCDALTWSKRSVAIPSFICSAAVIFFIWLFRKYLCFAQRLILCLAVSSMADTIQSMIEEADNMVSCRLRGYFANALGWLALLWIMAITLYLFLLVCKNLDTAKFEWVYHTVCWAFPFLFSLLPFFSDKYGPAGIWCWIVPDTGWRIVMWYGPLITFMFVMVIMYAYLVIKHRHNSRISHSWTPEIQEEWDMRNRNIRLIVIYPFIFICIRIFAVIYRVHEVIEPEHPVFVILLLTCIAEPLQGTLNAIAFSCGRSTKSDFTASRIKLAWHGHWHRTVPVVYPHGDIEEGNSRKQKELPMKNVTPQYENITTEDVTENDCPTSTSKETDTPRPNGYVEAVRNDETIIGTTSVTSHQNVPVPLPPKRRSRIKSSHTIEKSEPEISEAADEVSPQRPHHPTSGGITKSETIIS